MKKQKALVVLLTAIVLVSFASCSKDNKKETVTENESSQIETTEEPIDEEQRLNPLQISDRLYERCDKDVTLDASGNVKYLASLLYETEMIMQKRCMDIAIHKCDENKMLIDYTYASDNDLVEGTDIERHFELYEKDTGKLIKELIIDENTAYAEIKDKCISVESRKDGVFLAVTYDFELNEIAKFTSDKTEAIITSDGKRMYYVSKHRICMYDSKTGESKVFDPKNQFFVQGLSDVTTDKLGHDYIMFAGIAADYNAYNFIYDAYNCEVVHVIEQALSYETYDDIVISHQFSENYEQEGWEIGVSDDKKFIYDLADKSDDNNIRETVQLIVLNTGELMFNYSDEKNVYVEIYDKDNGKLKASTVIDVTSIRRKPLIELQEGEMEYYTDNMWVNGPGCYVADNVMLLTLADFYGTKYYLQWQMKEAVASNIITVYEQEGELIKSVDISGFTNQLLLPGEISAELEPLRERADMLEKEYDIEISIGEECSDICELYLIYPSTNYDEIEEALDKLQVALEKYPDNFFSQFRYEGVEGIDIHFASEILGTTDETLSVAGGLKCIEDDKLKLILDICDVYAFDTTFHHELCHAIDEVIWYNQATDEDPMFSEDKWNKLNPHEDMYSYSYVDWGVEKYWHYSYDNEISELGYDGGPTSAYFIDTYAMTYPTEDRARLFENVMREEGGYVEFENSPNLRNKVNYYAMCIRDAFDTTGWENVPWEAYLEDNVVDN